MSLKISKLNFYNVFFTGLIFTSVIAYFFIIDVQAEYKEKSKIIEEKYIKNEKVRIKNEVSRVVNKLNYYKHYVYNLKQKEFRDKVDYITSIVSKSMYNKNIIDILKADDRSDHYFFLFNKNGNIIYDSIDSSIVNKNIFIDNISDDLKRISKRAIESDVSYLPLKKIKNSKLTNIPIYAKKIGKRDLYLGIGIIKDDVESKIMNLIINQLFDDRYGDDSQGYFWLQTVDSTMIMHPLKQNLVGKNLENMKDPRGKYIFKEFRKAIDSIENGDYVEYHWYYKDNTIYKKMSYVKLIDDWDLIVGTGFYYKDIENMIANDEKFIEEFINSDIKKVITILAILMILTTAFAYYISRKIQRLEEEDIEHLRMLENYKIVLDESSIVSRTDKSGKIEYVNDEFCRVSGYEKGEVVGKSHNIIRHENTPRETFKELWGTILSGRVWRGVIKNRTRDNKSYYNKTTIVPLKDKNDEIIGFISCSSNITELIENKEKLENIFLTDRLTSLGSRFKLLQELEANSLNNNLIALIDIDRFREINNLYGQAIGDLLIKKVADKVFNELNKDGYMIFRIQADVFSVLTQGEDLSVFVEKIRRLVEVMSAQPITIKGVEVLVNFTTSFAKGDSNVLAYADTAIKNAKRNKRVYEIYSYEMQLTKEYEDNIYWVNTLKQAFKDDLLYPFFQPIYNYNTNKIEKYECLVRMVNSGEVIAPYHFLDVAKKTKLYSKITTTVAEKSINMFKNCDLEFSINLSVEDLLNSETMDYIYTLAKRANVFDRMVLEIVESEELQSFDEILGILNRFKEKGSKIAIDDFGSGYSTFDYLIYLNADYIKIDASIVKLINDDERALEVVQSIVNFAKKSGMKTIAEFVCNKEIDDKIRNLGIDYAQGFYYGEPKCTLIEEDKK
jgi:diguanylate cyclase (GGDEF)-like protein/PAS domain S-box-containing protein